MGEKKLMRGNEAIAEAAIRAGCRNYFAYPITPQAELLQWMANHMPEVENGTFLQAESEVGAISMVYGAASTGERTMTSSSSPGISLKQEGISYLAGSELPSVIVNIMRGGPGLGNIQPAQGDYFQSTKGGGHGDYQLIVLAPSTVPEAAELTFESFDLADKYRIPVMVLADGMIGQMMEPVELPSPIDPSNLPDKPWATTGTNGRDPNVIRSFALGAENLKSINLDLQEKYEKIRKREIRFEEIGVEDPDILLVAFGTVARIARTARRLGKKEGIDIGIFRPITLWPFPDERLAELSESLDTVLTVEMNAGQMVEDVRLSVKSRAQTPFYGEQGGVVPTPSEILEEVKHHV
ncbi:3-methyl-2-oxobutanoate dehydrogenase subunit VorB [Candidatus Bipolaricaulota bacterium]|nr:3-methyl-2-oxobutanoate dehydrogenase subunit VorB [Candidatus Bipolaricaulota bacterium]MBS3814086.1 3-methyl-2-oxobutanoate dehydrogenase subunit VorB [Candidatus Bipolaricaulota bacterium]MBS3825441.1 3-methyl-2-oxobutanoate dehydrogenase subunit VorB [Candidatus Bipolaricaulota bacterium]